MKTFGITFICINLLCASLNGQNSSETDGNKYNIKKINRFGLGGIYSGMIIENFGNETIPGFVAYNNYLIQSNHKLNYGLGVGFELYEKQLFIPSYINLLSFLNQNLFLDIQAGYSLGWKRKSDYYEDYVFHGGLFGGIGTGYKLSFNNEVNSFIEISYNYQNAKLESGTLSDNTVNIHSLLLTFGLLLEIK